MRADGLLLSCNVEEGEKIEVQARGGVGVVVRYPTLDGCVSFVANFSAKPPRRARRTPFLDLTQESVVPNLSYLLLLISVPSQRHQDAYSTNPPPTDRSVGAVSTHTDRKKENRTHDRSMRTQQRNANEPPKPKARARRRKPEQKSPSLPFTVYGPHAPTHRTASTGRHPANEID